MDSQKTLINIASVSERVARTLGRYAGHKTVESLQLDRIIVGCNAVLETLNKTLLLNDGSIDCRLTDWLASDEPRACLHALNQMERILNRKPTHGGGGFFQASSLTHTRDISNEAIGLLQTNKGSFHFLLIVTDIWNCENDTRRLQVPAQDSVTFVQEANDNRGPSQMMPRKNGDTSGVIQGGNLRKQAVDVERLKSIIEWLNAWNCNETYRRINVLRQPGTCTWLPNTHAFMTWKTMKDSFLWLHGKAGAGKSVLAASVIGNLKDTLKDGEILVFFYCDFRNERSTNAAEVMRSMLSQLLHQFSRNIVGQGDLIDELIKARDEGTLTTSDVMLLAHYVSRVAGQYSQQPFVVIDALDECQDVEDLLDALKELRKGSLRLLVTSRPLQVIKESLSAVPSISMDAMKYDVSADIELLVMRFLDSDRRLRFMDIGLKKEIYSALCEKADGMFRWVQCQLDVLKRCMTAARVREVLNNLPSDLDRTYERILLKIDKDEEGEVVRRTLEWLVAALVPLQLSQIIESLSIDVGRQVLDPESRPVHGPALLDALGSLVTHDELTDVVILSHFSVKEYLMGELIRTKHPPYHIDRQGAHTQVALLCIHYIVAHVRRGKHPGGYCASPRTAHRPQINYDNYDIAVARTSGRPVVSLQSFVSHPLLEYVLHHGFLHLAYINPSNQAILRAIIDLQLHAQEHPLEWEQLCNKTCYSIIPWPSLEHDLVVYILIAFAPEPMLRLYLDHYKPKLKDGTNPLIYGAFFSKIEHSRTLLSRGVSLNCSSCHVRSSLQLLPLEVAVEQEDRTVVDLLLEAGSPVPQKLFVRALLEGQICVFPGHNVARLLQTDEFVEWGTGIHDKEVLLRALNPARYIPHPRYQPSERDIDIIQRRLVQIDCDPYSRFNEKSLRIAVSAGHVSTVKHMLSLNVPLPHDILLDVRGHSPKPAMIRFLLSVGSDVHVNSPDKDTPLHMIISSWLPDEDKCLENVQALVDAGCNPSACNLAGQTPLHRATMRGYISVIKYLLSLQVEIPPDIMLAAAQSHSASTMRLLMSKGADVDAIGADGDTILHLALRNYHEIPDVCLEHVKILINASCDLYARNALGEAPFDVAANNASPMVIQYLLSLNIQPPPSILLSVCDRKSWNMAPIIELLISQGADVHSTRPNGDTPLHLSMAARSEVECLRRLETLISAGCNAHACNLAGETPFHIAARRGYIPVMEYLLSIGVSAPLDVILTVLKGYHSGRRSTIHFLLDKSVDVHVSEDGMTLLHFAAALHEEEDALEVVKLLVHAGCNPSALNSAQGTPLHIAAQHGHVSVVDYLLSLGAALPPDVLCAASHGYSKKAQLIRYLVDRGADASVATADGNTPLHLILEEGEKTDRLESVQVLVDAGCDPEARNLAGETPLHTAAKNGFVTVVKYFHSKGVPLPHDLLRTSTAATIRFFLGKGVDAYGISIDDDKELMHRAIDADYFDSDDEDRLECVRILVDLGWDPSLRDSSGETPMHVATRGGHISVVEYFLSRSVPLPADVLLVAVTSSTEYIWRSYAVLSMTRFLISKGASVNITAQNGDTPLHLALKCNFMDRDVQLVESDERCLVLRNSWELVKTLLTHGADPTAKNVDGQTSFDLAETQGHSFRNNFQRLVQAHSTCMLGKQSF